MSKFLIVCLSFLVMSCANNKKIEISKNNKKINRKVANSANPFEAGAKLGIINFKLDPIKCLQTDEPIGLLGDYTEYRADTFGCMYYIIKKRFSSYSKITGLPVTVILEGSGTSNKDRCAMTIKPGSAWVEIDILVGEKGEFKSSEEQSAAAQTCYEKVTAQFETGKHKGIIQYLVQ